MDAEQRPRFRERTTLRTIIQKHRPALCRPVALNAHTHTPLRLCDPQNMGIEPSFFAMHAGSALRPQPLTAGHRLDVVFALARPKRPGRPSASSLSSASTALTAASDAAAPSPYAEALEATRAALAAWAANDQAPPALVFLLSNTYEREAMEQAAAEAAERGCAAGVPGLLEDGDFALAEALAEALRRGGSGAGEGEAWASRADAFVASCTVTTSGLGRGASASGRAKAAPDGSLPPSKHRRPSLESPTAAGTASASASAHPADHHHHAEEEESPFDGDVTTSVEIADLLALCSESIWPPPHARARLHLELAEDGAVAGAPSPGRASGLVDVPSAVVLNLPEEGLKPNSREEPGFGELRLIARRSAVVLWRHECAAQLLCREPAAAAERVGALVSAGAAGCSGGAAPLSAAATALTAGLLVQLALYAVNSGHCLTSTSSAAVRSAVEAALARAAEGGASGAAGPTAPAVAALGEAAARELLKLRAEDIYGDDFEPSDFADTAVQRGEVLAAFGALMPSCGAFAPVCAAAAGAVAARGTLLEAAQLLEGADRAGGGGGGGARFRACAAALSRVAAEQRKSLLRRCSGDEAAFALAKIVPLLRLRAPDLLESTLGALLFLHKRLPVSALPASASAAAFAAADDLLVPAALLSVAPEELCAAAVASASDPRLRGAPPEEREGDVLARCLATLREQQLTRQERPPGAGCSAAAAAVAALAPGPLGQRRSLIFDCEEWTPAAIPDWSLPLAFCPTGRRCPVCHGLVAFLEDSTCREATLEDLKTSHVRHVRRVLRAVVPGLAVVAESTTATSAAAQAAATPPPALKAAGRAAAAWRVRVRKLRPRNWAELEQEGVMISRADVFQELLLVLGKMQPPGPGGA